MFVPKIKCLDFTTSIHCSESICLSRHQFVNLFKLGNYTSCLQNFPLTRVLLLVSHLLKLKPLDILTNLSLIVYVLNSHECFIVASNLLNVQIELCIDVGLHRAVRTRHSDQTCDVLKSKNLH
jgi:hypothetical protein